MYKSKDKIFLAFGFGILVILFLFSGFLVKMTSEDNFFLDYMFQIFA